MALRCGFVAQEHAHEFSIVECLTAIFVALVKDLSKLRVGVLEPKLGERLLKLVKVDVSCLHNIKEFEHFDEGSLF